MMPPTTTTTTEEETTAVLPLAPLKIQTSPTQFLDALKESEQIAGIFLRRQFLSSQEADAAFSVLNDDKHFPWDHNPVLFGEALTQHAYYYERNGNPNEYAGIDLIESLCTRIETLYDGKISDVFCNRFHHVKHNIGWHRDTYGEHILVLSLGSRRNIQFRKRQLFGKREVVTVRPNAGDIYFMPLQLNKTHMHRVCKANPIDQDDGPRISLVFFIQAPKYAKEYKIGRMDRAVGWFNSMLE